MRNASAKRSVLLTAALFAAGPCVVPESVGATELGATHLVFESATSMKRVDAALFMSLVDRSVKNDEPGNRRRLRCAVAAMGKKGALPARGQVVLRLRGEDGRGFTWQGSQLTEPLDSLGEAEFDEEGILELVDEARADGAEPRLFSIEFEGGQGKKVTQVSVECIHEVADE